jgi:PiT family inorganic phosphate transporter
MPQSMAAEIAWWRPLRYLEMALTFFIVVVITALAFNWVNGLTNGGGLVATVITTRAMDPVWALVWVAVCEMAGLFLFGQAVARTLAHNVLIFPEGALPRQMLLVLSCGFTSALVWYTGMWYLSLPTASSHALIGGMVGAAVYEYGRAAVNWPVVLKIIIFLAAIPVIGVITGLVLARVTYWVGSFLTPAAKGLFRFLEVLTLAGVALVQGSNDGQKGIAMIWMGSAALVSAGLSHGVMITPMIILCGLAMAAGVLMGSRRIISTLGKRLYRIDELQGFCAEISTMALVGLSSHWGYPMSTSQILSTSILGAGVAVQPRDIRWDLVGNIGIAWVVTLPAAAGLAAFFTWMIPYVVS